MYSRELTILASLLCFSRLVMAQTAPATSPAVGHPLKPNLKFPTLASYETEIGEPGMLLQGDHLWLFAPKTRTREANAIFKILVRAYDELYRVVGVHTKYKLIV